MTVEVLAIGAHPDDADIGVGGILCKLAKAGKRVGILDLTRGELGTRGTVEERTKEAAEAARILGVAERANAGLPDGGLANTLEQQRVVAGHIRRLRPRILLAPLDRDRHPDHDAAHALVRDSAYFAGLAKWEADREPHRPERIFWYRVYGDDTKVTFVMNITDEFAQKREAMQAFRSQFHNPDYKAPETFVSSPAFWNAIETRAAYWGSRIGVAYGEALHSLSPVGLETLPGLEN
mgnify:CR=1 FL=1